MSDRDVFVRGFAAGLVMIVMMMVLVAGLLPWGLVYRDWVLGLCR